MSINFNDKAHTYVSNAEYQAQLTSKAIKEAIDKCKQMADYCEEYGYETKIEQGNCSASDIVLYVFKDSTWQSIRSWLQLREVLGIDRDKYKIEA